MFNTTLLNHIDALKAKLDRLRPLPPDLAVIKTEDRAMYIDAIVAWQSDGDDTALKETIAKCVESSLVEILSLAGEG